VYHRGARELEAPAATLSVDERPDLGWQQRTVRRSSDATFRPLSARPSQLDSSIVPATQPDRLV